MPWPCGLMRPAHDTAAGEGVPTVPTCPHPLAQTNSSMISTRVPTVPTCPHLFCRPLNIRLRISPRSPGTPGALQAGRATAGRIREREGERGTSPRALPCLPPTACPGGPTGRAALRLRLRAALLRPPYGLPGQACAWCTRLEPHKRQAAAPSPMTSRRQS